MAVALEQLLSLLTEEQKRGVRLGYVLGHHDAEHGYPEAVPPGSPEHRYLLDMRLIDPDLW